MRVFIQMLGGLLLLAIILVGFKYRHTIFDKSAVNSDGAGSSVAVLEGALSGGDGTILVLDHTAKIYGFGENNRGQVDFGMAYTITRPTALLSEESAILPAPQWARVHAGDGASYMISRDGNLWRRPFRPSTLGMVRKPQRTVDFGNARLFAEINPSLKWKKAEQMWRVGAGITRDDQLYFWRESSLLERDDQQRRDPNNAYPQPEDPFAAPQMLKRLGTADGDKWQDFCIGMGLIYAVANDGTLWFSGNLSGVLSAGSKDDVPKAEATKLTQVNVAAKLKRIYCRANAQQVLALDNTAQLWGFGLNTFGEVGDGDGDPFKARKKIPREAMQKVTDKRWVAIALAPSSSFGISTDGALWAWGQDVDWKEGPTDGNASSAPVLIDKTRKWAAVTSTHNARAALTADGKLFTWGSNRSGALGDGNVASRRDALTAVDSAVEWKNSLTESK